MRSYLRANHHRISSVSKHRITLAISERKNMVPVESLVSSISRKSRVEKQDPLFCCIDRICPFCKKRFCCKECCNNHMKIRHPNQNADCVLCSSQTLPLRQYVFEGLPLKDEKLLCHIVNKHLPLRCILCGDLFKTKEDFKFFGPCKWYTEYHQLMFERLSLPVTPAFKGPEEKSKESFSSGHRPSPCITTPPEIYRNTSTPMFTSQKSSFEYQMPFMPNFFLKTPRTKSPMIEQSNATSNSYESQQTDSDTKFFSFSSSALENEETTPSRNNDDEQFVRNNFEKLETRKLYVKKELDDTANNEAEEIELYEEEMMSPVNMDLTSIEGGILQDSPKLNSIHEESGETSGITKKVRFSDQNETLPEFERQAESIAQDILNVTEEEIFHDAHNASRAKNTKDTRTNLKDTENTKIVKSMLDTKDTKDSQTLIGRDSLVNSSENSLTNSPKDFLVDSPKRPLMNSSKNSLDNTQDKISQDNEKNKEKENRSEDALVNILSTVNQQGSSKVLMMVLVENNVGELSNNLIPLIDLGLKKLKDQISSVSSNIAETSSAANSGGYSRRSITKMQMSISSVESCSNNNADQRQVVLSSPLPSTENYKNNSGGGILSIFSQAVKCAFKNLSDMASSSVERTQINQRREIVEESLPGSSTSGTTSNLDSNLEVRPGKRGRDINGLSSCMDTVTLPSEARSPMAKRLKGLYEIKGRQPISRMRNNDNRVTSSRGISSETQTFRHGSLTVGDTILPLPARAYQLTKEE